MTRLRRAAWPASLLVAAAACTPFRAPEAPSASTAGAESVVPPSPAAAPEPPPRVAFAAHLDAPIPEGGTVVWCATLQMAWDGMRRDFVGDGPLVLGPPASRELSAAMSAARLPEDAVDPASVAVAVGPGPETSARFAREVLERFGARVEMPEVEPQEHVALAWLQKELLFPHAFEVFDRGLRFAGSERTLRAFGINKSSRVTTLRDIRGQVVVHRGIEEFDPMTPREEGPSPAEFVLELAVRGEGDRLLIGRRAPGPTLRAAWEAVRRDASGPGKPLPEHSIVGIPRFDFDRTQRFPELEGPLEMPPVRDARVRLAMQRCAFRLDERGALLQSKGGFRNLKGGVPTFLCDRPFLLALVRRGAEVPYLLVWVGNDDLLVAE